MPEGAGPRLVVAFDHGARRIGAARGDTLSRTAAPLAPIRAGDGGPRWEEVDAVVREWRPALMVVGLPYNADGSESGSTRAARAFAAAVAARYGLPVELVDERYSSLEAQSRLQSARAAGTRRKRVRKTDVDAAAACVILERWLSAQPVD